MEHDETDGRQLWMGGPFKIQLLYGGALRGADRTKTTIATPPLRFLTPLICGNRTNAVVASLAVVVPRRTATLVSKTKPSCFSAYPLNDATGAPASWHSSNPA